MCNIVCGTTPSIKYIFSKVNVNDINVAILTVKRYGQITGVALTLTDEDGSIIENRSFETLYKASEEN